MLDGALFRGHADVKAARGFVQVPFQPFHLSSRRTRLLFSTGRNRRPERSVRTPRASHCPTYVVENKEERRAPKRKRSPRRRARPNARARFARGQNSRPPPRSIRMWTRHCAAGCESRRCNLHGNADFRFEISVLKSEIRRSTWHGRCRKDGAPKFPCQLKLPFRRRGTRAGIRGRIASRPRCSA